MAWMSFGLLVTAAVIAVAEARSLPREPLSIAMGPNGAPMLMMRSKRQPIPPYPHRAMMFTGYYRPTRSDNGPLTGVFARGNAVSGDSFLGTSNPNYLQSGPEPGDDPEVTSSEAEAAPESDDGQTYSDNGTDEEQQQVQPQEQDEIQPYGTEAPVSEEPIAPQTHSVKRPSKAHKTTKHGKKTKVHVEEAEEEAEAEDEDEDEESDEEEPYEAHRGKTPNLNNFFPMVFRFPSSYGRRGSEYSGGSPPGMITAIANSYSTAKGGVASSVATAYGGSPNGKKKRAKSSKE